MALCATSGLAACVGSQQSAAPSLSRDLPHCGFQDIESGAEPDEKLSNGMVGRAGGYGVPQGFGSYYQVEDCRTGATLDLTKSRTSYADAGEVKAPDRAKEVETVRQILLAGGVQDLAELDQLARRNRISTMAADGPGTESCGCATFYPDLRGGKAPYVIAR